MDYDILLAGGGLANGLIALRLAQTRPEVRVGIVEAGKVIGGNHTWSSFAEDLTPEQRDWTAPLFAYRWDSYEVRFPGQTRRLEAGYGSCTSENLAAEVARVMPKGSVMTDMPIVAVTPTSVTLADQRVLTAHAVIDGRGQGPTKALDLRWQKFLGQEVELAEPHGLDGPIIMDATVPQFDGYRFVYTLPFGPKHVLIEDTYFSDGSDLSPDLLRRHLADYAAGQGWTITSDHPRGSRHPAAGHRRRYRSVLGRRRRRRAARRPARRHVPPGDGLQFPRCGAHGRPDRRRCRCSTPRQSIARPATIVLQHGRRAACIGCSTACCSLLPRMKSAATCCNASMSTMTRWSGVSMPPSRS